MPNRTYVVRVPCHVAHTTATTHCQPGTKPLQSSLCTCTSTICQCSHLPFASQVPYNGVACAARRSQSILDVMVPRERCDFIQFGAASPRRIRLTGVAEVPYVDLRECQNIALMTIVNPYFAVHSARREQICLDWVKVEPSHRTSVSFVAENQ